MSFDAIGMSDRDGVVERMLNKAKGWQNEEVQVEECSQGHLMP